MEFLNNVPIQTLSIAWLAYEMASWSSCRIPLRKAGAGEAATHRPTNQPDLSNDCG